MISQSGKKYTDCCMLCISIIRCNRKIIGFTQAVDML